MSKKRQPGTFVLHAYQNIVVADICRRSQDVLVEQPTGSGKTVEIVAIMAKLLGTSYSHAIIAAPQEQIEASFVHRSYQHIVADKKVLAAGPEKIRAAREGNSSLRNLREYFKMPDPRFALACTHAGAGLPSTSPAAGGPGSPPAHHRRGPPWPGRRPEHHRPRIRAGTAPAFSTSRPRPSARTGCRCNCRACT